MASKNVTRSFTLRSRSTLNARPSPVNSAVTLVELPELASTSNANASSDPTTGKKRKAEGSTPSPRKAKVIKMELDAPHAAPNNWRTVYAIIEDMRRGVVAPVDTMGCHTSMMDLKEEPRTKRFMTLVSLMLSSQTKDEVTSTAVANLRRSLDGLTLENVLVADIETIQTAICKVGFWRRKAEYIKQTAAKLQSEFDGDVPRTVEGLCSLPGVGPKMAFLALQVAWEINLGIGVDVHVHRITNRLGWHRQATKTPEETRLNLQSWLPPDLYGPINPLLVGFGQTICLPTSPRCGECKLSSGLCPSAKIDRKRVTSPKKAQPSVKIELEDDIKAEEDLISYPLTTPSDKADP